MVEIFYHRPTAVKYLRRIKKMFNVRNAVLIKKNGHWEVRVNG